jgi:hypothetical protein
VARGSRHTARADLGDAGPLIVALAWRVFLRHDRRWPVVLLLAAVLLLGAFWALIVLMVAPPLLLGAALYWRRLRRRDLALAGALAGGVLLVHVHWLVGLLGTHLEYVAPAGVAKLTWRRFVDACSDRAT